MLEIIVCCQRKSLRSYLHPSCFRRAHKAHWAKLCGGRGGGWSAFESGFNGGPLSLISLKSFCIFCWLKAAGAILPLICCKERHTSVPFYQTRTVGRLPESTTLQQKLKYGHHVIHSPWKFSLLEFFTAQSLTVSHLVKIDPPPSACQILPSGNILLGLPLLGTVLCCFSLSSKLS